MEVTGILVIFTLLWARGHGVDTGLYDVTGSISEPMANTSLTPVRLTVTLSVLVPVMGVNSPSTRVKLYVDKKGGFYGPVDDLKVDMWDLDLGYLNHPSALTTTRRISDGSDSTLQRVANDIKAAYSLATFNPIVVYIVQYGGYTNDTKTYDAASNTRNTYQGALASDGNSTFVVMKFLPDKMEWWKDQSGKYATIKVMFGSTELLSVPGSGTESIQDTAVKGNTPGQPGLWITKVDGDCPACVSVTGSGYAKKCVNETSSVCACTSCTAVSPIAPTVPPSGGLTQDEIIITSVVCTIGGLGLIIMCIVLCWYFKKKNKPKPKPETLVPLS